MAQPVLARLGLSFWMACLPVSAAVAQTPAHDRARTLIGQRNYRGAIAELTPLVRRGCDATAYFLTGSAHSMLRDYLGTMRAMTMALECRPALTQEQARDSVRLLVWAVREDERAQIRVRGTIAPGH
jgi:hypothetical protein